jgi:hypothetical protein
MTEDEIMAAIIQRYLKEEDNKDVTIEDIQAHPRWERVILYWLAMEKYEGKKLMRWTVEEIKSIYGD